MFALQDGGMCLSSSTAHKTFQRYGISRRCKSDGRGGKEANHVYVIGGIKGMTTLFIFFIYRSEEKLLSNEGRRPRRKAPVLFQDSAIV